MSTKYPILTLCYKCSHVESFGFRDFFENDRDFKLINEINMVIEEIKDESTEEKRKYKLFEAILTISSFRPDVLKYFATEDVVKKIGYKVFSDALVNYHTRGSSLKFIIKAIQHFNKEETLYIFKEYLENRDLESLDTISLFLFDFDSGFWLELFDNINERAKIALIYTPIYQLKSYQNIGVPLLDSSNYVKASIENMHDLKQVIKVLSDDKLITHVQQTIDTCKNKRKHEFFSSLYPNSNSLYINYLLIVLCSFGLKQKTNNLHYFDFICSKIANIDESKNKQHYFFILHNKDKIYVEQLFNVFEKYFPNSIAMKKTKELLKMTNLNNMSPSAKIEFLEFEHYRNAKDKEEAIEAMINILQHSCNDEYIEKIPDDFKELLELNFLY